MNAPSARCACRLAHHTPRFIAVTGGPGAGKTAVLEVMRRQFCEHIVVLPESASILYRGGFPRDDDPIARRGTQRAIYAVQTELERIEREHRRAAIVLCDRGTLDGAVYWPGPWSEYFAEVGTTYEKELARYDLVLHLRVPSLEEGYDHSNPVRVETAEEAALLDERIRQVWEGHPHRLEIPAHQAFLDKVSAALRWLRAELPPCCRQRVEAQSA